MPDDQRARFAERAANWRRVRIEVAAPERSTLYVVHTRGVTRAAWAKPFELTAFWLKFPDWPRELPQTRFVLTLDDPAAPPICFVWFAADVRHEDVPDAWLEFRWSFAAPSEQARLEIAGWDRASFDDIAFTRLTKGKRFFRETTTLVQGGRPAGTVKHSRGELIDGYRTYADQLGRRPTQAQFCEWFGVSRLTLRNNLTLYKLWPWSTFQSSALGARTIRKRVN